MQPIIICLSIIYFQLVQSNTVSPLLAVKSFSFWNKFTVTKFNDPEAPSSDQRMRSQGSRGCPVPIGDISVNISDINKKILLVDSLSPTIEFYVSASPVKSHQTIKITVLESQSKNEIFTKNYEVEGEQTIRTKLQLSGSKNYLVVAEVECNQNRPSTNKNLRFLLIPNVKSHVS